MAHPEQFQFMDVLKKHFPHYFHNQKVAEIGSLDINGSIRNCFETAHYDGFDVSEGPGVDFAIQGQLVGQATGYYDVTISSECFEHNPFWVETFANMLRLTRPGGMVIMSCATTGRAEHGTDWADIRSSPLTQKIGWNYYKNLTADDFLQKFNLAGWFSGFQFLSNPHASDLYFYGIRSGETLDLMQIKDITSDLMAYGVKYNMAWLQQGGEVFMCNDGNNGLFLNQR